MDKKAKKAGAKKRVATPAPRPSCDMFGCDGCVGSFSCGGCAKRLCAKCAVGCLRHVRVTHFAIKCLYCRSLLDSDTDGEPLTHTNDSLKGILADGDCRGTPLEVDPVCPSSGRRSVMIKTLPCMGGCYGCVRSPIRALV